MLGYITTQNSNVSAVGLYQINYLIGEFNVSVYLYKADLWTKIGSGASSISSSEKLLTEKIEILNENELHSMNNTIAFVSANDYKMMVLDLSSGTMEVYKGKLLDDKLIFCNSETEANSIEPESVRYCTKLIFTQLSQDENQMVIGRSKDDGKTWIPYLKTVYRRKK